MQAKPKLEAGSSKKSHVRWFVVFMLFVLTTINYADRATLSIV
ncbi:hypothetical protein, partial [Priestia megaterium]